MDDSEAKSEVFSHVGHLEMPTFLNYQNVAGFLIPIFVIKTSDSINEYTFNLNEKKHFFEQLQN